jgi:Restriction endonuclease
VFDRLIENVQVCTVEVLHACVTQEHAGSRTRNFFGAPQRLRVETKCTCDGVQLSRRHTWPAGLKSFDYRDIALNFGRQLRDGKLPTSSNAPHKGSYLGEHVDKFITRAECPGEGCSGSSPKLELARETKGHPFATFVADLLKTMGYRTRVSPEGTDGGVDIVAHRDELGLEPPIIKVQVKSTEGKVGDPDVSALYGKVGSTEYGLVVTLGYFTPPAIQFARGRSNLRLIDGEDLVKLILEHYEKLDSKYKAMIPLKRAYIPEPPDEDGE